MEINGSTKIFAIVGNPVSHSLSPSIHNFLFRRFRLNAVYVALPTRHRELGECVRALGGMSCGGVNLTTPFKDAIFPHLARCSRGARNVGAINTLVRRRGGWTGYNTDGVGFIDWLEGDFDCSLTARRVTLLGAGAAARAVSGAVLGRRPRSLTIINRSARRFRHPFFEGIMARKNVALVRMGDVQSCRLALEDSDVIINATSWGLGGRVDGGENSVPWDLGRSGASVVIDLNYGAREGWTAFLSNVSSGARVADGRGMLRWQAARSFELWNGVSLSARDHRDLARHLVNLDPDSGGTL